MPPPAHESPHLALPPSLLPKILAHLSTSSLHTATLVCRRWRTLIFSSGPRSLHILQPHLPTLRAHFGAEAVPARLPLQAVRALLHRYAAQTLFGNHTALAAYSSAAALGAAAVCGSLLAHAERGLRRVRVVELGGGPPRLLACVKADAPIAALAVSEGYLCAVGASGQLTIWQLLARGSTRFLCVRSWSVRVDVGAVKGVAISPGHARTGVVVAVVGAQRTVLVHPAHAISVKRGEFFKNGVPVLVDGEEKGKGVGVAAEGRLGRWILCVKTPEDATGEVVFALGGRQTQLAGVSGFLGAGWAKDDSRQLAKRRIGGIEDGVEVSVGAGNSPDEVFSWYRTRLTEGGERRWGLRAWEDADWDEVKIVYDSYAIATERDTGRVCIVNVVPWAVRCTLYRRARGHSGFCGYAVYEGEKQKRGTRKIGGYVAFTMGEGRLRVLPLVGVSEWTGDEMGWEMVHGCRDIAIGTGEVAGMFAGKGRVVVVFDNRIVVVRLWAQAREADEYSLGNHGRLGRVGRARRRWKAGMGGDRCEVM